MATNTPTDPNDPHQILGVPKGASEKQVQDAYRKKLRDVHPDRDAGISEAQRKTNAEQREALLRAQNDLTNEAQGKPRASAPTPEQVEFQARSPWTSSSSGPQSRYIAPQQSLPPAQASNTKNFAKGLAAARVRGMLVNGIVPQRIRKEVQPPSKVRYGLAKIIALIAELTDLVENIIAALELLAAGGAAVATAPAAGSGALPVWLVSFFIWIGEVLIEVILFDIPIALLIGGHHMRTNEQVIEVALRETDVYRRKVMSLQTQYSKVLRFANRSPLLKKGISKIALRFASINAYLKKSVWGRLGKRFGIELIPIIDIWPTRYLGVRKQEKHAWEAYEMAQEAMRELELTAAQAGELQTFIEQHGAEAFQQMQAAQQEAQEEEQLKLAA